MEVLLRRWWADKYKLPSTHRLFQESTVFELLTEYYEDLYDDDTMAALDAIRGEDGEVVFDDSDFDDPLLAKWESQIAQGIDPDLEEGMSDKAKEKLKQERERKRGAREIMNVNDDFGSAANRAMSQYRSQYVIPGSPEDVALRRASAARRDVPGVLGQEVKRRGR